MAFALSQMTITVGSPGLLNGRQGRHELADFYGALLGMQVVDEGWLRIAKDRESPLQLALDGDGWSDQRAPRWPDPEYPQQMHLDIAVPDLEAVGALVVGRGATLLQDNGHWRVYADPAGHPLCLYVEQPAGDGGGTGVVGALTFDCFSPRSLASFYQGLFGVDDRIEDEPDRVVISLDDPRFPNLAFQHAQFVAARWPDPAYPAQLHVDWRFGNGKDDAVARAEKLGAIRLPKLADTEIFADPAGHPFCL